MRQRLDEIFGSGTWRTEGLGDGMTSVSTARFP
jgi:hypothetical protein